MTYGKVVLNGFIGAVVIGGGTPISKTEYNEIINKIHNKPAAPDGFKYVLQDNPREWVLVELPPAPEDEEIPPEEATEILMGGESG